MIRAPRPDDLGALIDLGRAFHSETGYEKHFPEVTFDPESFAKTLALLAQAGLLCVVDKGEGPVGMAAVDAAPLFFNHKVMLSREAFWYVDPAHRTGIGRSLLPAMEQMAQARGAIIMDVVAEDGKRSKPLARIYEAGGYSLAEHTFRKRL